MDMDSQIMYRERIAENILFKPALDRASALNAARVFTTMFPGGTLTKATTTRKPRAKETEEAATTDVVKAKSKKAAEASPVQMRMTDYFKNTQFLNAVKKITKSDDASSTGSSGSGSPKRAASKKK